MTNIITQEEKDRIDALCKEYEIKYYSINNDGSIDVDGNVILGDLRLTSIPIKFNKVSGEFNCVHNQLTSLEGCPVSVGGAFSGQYNKLTSLIGCPQEVGGNFYVHHNELTSVDYYPTKLGMGFYINYNQLTSLKGSPDKVGGAFYCNNNKLTSLEHCPVEVGVEVFGEFLFYNNKLPPKFDYGFSRLGNYDEYGDTEEVSEDQKIFLKYQHYYDVWTPEFNLENMQLLLDDIKDGLR